MTAITKFLTVGLLATSLAGNAVAQTMHHHGEPEAKPEAARMPDMQTAMMPKASDAPSTKDFKEADMAMMHDMHVPYTGNADVDFRTHMIPHHQGAIDMAKVALRHAKDPATHQMAQKIIDDQEREIAEMRFWLKQHGK